MTTRASDINGLGVALVTPFSANGKVDFPSLQAVVEHVIQGGADFLVALGTTGETPTLSMEEQRRVTDFVLEVNRGRLPVVVGVTGNATERLCAKIAAWDANGISAFLVAAPAYNKPSQQGLEAHFIEVANAACRPVILYNVPGRTSCNLSAETTLTLAQHPNIVGIKEASGDLSQISTILRDRPAGFNVYSGDDALALPTVSMGADGLISVIGNAYPKEMSSMIQQAAFGQIHDARGTHDLLSKLMALLFEEGNPTGIKATLSHLKLCGPKVRLPLVQASDQLTNRLYAAIAELDVPAS